MGKTKTPFMFSLKSVKKRQNLRVFTVDEAAYMKAMSTYC